MYVDCFAFNDGWLIHREKVYKQTVLSDFSLASCYNKPNIRYHSNRRMGNTPNNLLTISVSAPSGRMFDFHKDVSIPSDQQALAYPSFLTYNHKSVHYQPNRTGNGQQYEIRYTQGLNNPELWIRPTDGSSMPIWRSLEGEEIVELEQGDVMKLGETQLTVEKICSKYSDLSCWETQLNNQTINQIVGGGASLLLRSASRKRAISRTPARLHSRQKSRPRQSAKLNCDSRSTLRDPNQASCRICLDYDNSVTNPLLSACNCAGSVQLIHYGCLRTWLSTRTRTTYCESYEYTQCNLTCDLCKTPIKQRVSSNGQVYSLHGQSGMMHPPYAVLRVRQSQNQLRQYTINFHNKGSVILGSSKTCDLPFHSRYIDKQHCELRIEDGKLWLHNYCPVYGTFASLKERKVGLKVNLMMGGHLVTIDRGTPQCCESVPLELKLGRTE